MEVITSLGPDTTLPEDGVSTRTPAHSAGDVKYIESVDGATGDSSRLEQVDRTPGPSNPKQRKGSGRIHDTYSEYRVKCQRLLGYARELKKHLLDESDNAEVTRLSVEIEGCLLAIDRISFGKDESLARCVIAIESVILNEKLAVSHAEFLEDVSAFLANRSYIDDSTVSHVYDIIRDHGLDEFRGVF